MIQPRPFHVEVSDRQLNAILTRVAGYPWSQVRDEDTWQYGTNPRFLRRLCEYWVESYDWRLHESTINRFSHFVAPINALNVHYIAEPGSGPNPLPLILSHGWPGSVIEFLNVIEPLAHPERFGGNIEDAFDVIAPSLPGFGFSTPPVSPMGPRAIATVFNSLMTGTLGYEKYMAQGGDWGGAISTWLGFDHPSACQAIHINIMMMRHKDGPQTPEEQRWARDFEDKQILQNGYRTQQATKPNTLSYAMLDSPVGVAAWIVEKFHAWSDLDNDDIESVHSKDTLLTNIMVYLITGTFNTAAWIYYGRREEGGRLLSPDGHRVEVPTAAALFPAEMLTWPPRSYVERCYNVTRWTEMPRGGHFAALEQPAFLVEDIRAFARGLRKP